MNSATQSQKAQQFRALHEGPGMLVLPNAWDVIGARLIEEAGFPAIATSSAGVAWALGWPDGERISRGEMLAVVRRIALSVRIPVTAAAPIGQLAREIDGPLNVIAGPPAPPLSELERLGVRRASLGPRVVQATLGLIRRIAVELRDRGTYATMADLVIPFGDIQKLVAPPT